MPSRVLKPLLIMPLQGLHVLPRQLLQHALLLLLLLWLLLQLPLLLMMAPKLLMQLLLLGLQVPMQLLQRLLPLLLEETSQGRSRIP